MQGPDGNDIGLRPKELSARLRITHSTLYNWRRQAKGPPYYRIGREIYYKFEDVQRWIDEKRVILGAL